MGQCRECDRCCGSISKLIDALLDDIEESLPLETGIFSHPEPLIQKEEIAMVAAKDGGVFVRVKDLSGEEFVCPINALKSVKELSPEELDECVDSATVGRYSGNIKIAED